MVSPVTYRRSGSAGRSCCGPSCAFRICTGVGGDQLGFFIAARLGGGRCKRAPWVCGCRLECRRAFFIFFTSASLGGGRCKCAPGVCGCRLERRRAFPSSSPADTDPSIPFAVWLKDFLLEFDDVVNPSKSLPPLQSSDVFHHIKTTGSHIFSRFRRLDGEKLATAKKEFEQLERNGIVRCSDSPWSSPLHVVEKADGIWRPCGDFRRLNLVMEPDSYLLPNMLDFAHVAAGCSIFSKIDLRKGYNQIPVHPDDICKTAISTPFGLFEYTRMPFGLRNAGNTFQRKIDRVKNQLEFCFAYQDDLEVASKDDIQHRLHLRQVFLRLRQHGLVINTEKCVFGAPSIDFLCHRVTAGGVTHLPTYFSSVLDFPRPNTVKELQGFLGLLNFYRRFLPAVARTLQPLTDALRGDRKGNTRSTGPLRWRQLSQLPRRRWLLPPTWPILYLGPF
jgi:hypothetical protein